MYITSQDIIPEDGAKWQALVTDRMLDYPETIYKTIYKKDDCRGMLKKKYAETHWFGLLQKTSEMGMKNYDTVYKGYESEKEPEEYSLYAAISRKAWDVNKDKELQRYAEAFAISINATREAKAMEIFNLGFSSYTTPDGKTVFATDHPIRPGTTETFRNTPSTPSDLTYTALKQAIIDMRSLVNGRGIPIMARPKYLLVPPELELVAEEILGSKYIPYEAWNTKNVLFSKKIQIIVCDYLTDPDAWFLVWDKVDSELHPLRFIEGVSPETDMKRIWDKNNAVEVRAYDRFAFHIIGARGIYGSPGA